jgi:cytochrome P450 family 3 subfamily A
MAGYAGTASLLANMSFLLAQHPKEQETLIQEIDSFSTQELNFDIIQNCKFLDAVVWETLRLFPPVARVERECTSDYKLSRSGITVPAGMTVSIPIYAIHRDPRNFEDPDNFVPERFMSTGDEEGSILRHPWCFLPFGGGPRNCLGIRLAILEAKLCIAQLLRRYRFHVEPGSRLEHVSDQILVSPVRAPIRLEKRKVAGKSLLLKKNSSHSIRSDSKRLKRKGSY